MSTYNKGSPSLSSVRRCDAFFVDLHNLFLDICELYVDIVVDKDGHSSKVDEMSKQQIYFLTVEPDDFSEILKRPSTSERMFELYCTG